MDAVEKVLTLCKERGVRVSRLEKDLGFSNGYIKGLRRGILPIDRAAQVAKYFNIPIETFTSIESDSQKREEKPATDGDGRKDDNIKIAEINRIKIAEINRLLPRLTEEELDDVLSRAKATILGQ